MYRLTSKPVNLCAEAQLATSWIATPPGPVERVIVCFYPAFDVGQVRTLAAERVGDTGLEGLKRGIPGGAWPMG
jgi:hypothetical protein